MGFNWNVHEGKTPGIRSLYEKELKVVQVHPRKLMTDRGIMVYGCSECPLPTNIRDVNIGDEDEGWYFCPLFDKEIWGENPECEHNVFQMLARALLNYVRG